MGSPDVSTGCSAKRLPVLARTSTAAATGVRSGTPDHSLWVNLRCRSSSMGLYRHGPIPPVGRALVRVSAALP